MKKIILDLCGGTGAWSKPWKDNGYDVRVITLPEYDVRTYILPTEPIYGILAAPPCTMFSMARTNALTPRDLPGGLEIVLACLNIIWKAQMRITNQSQKQSPLKFWALENPYYGFLKWYLGKPSFVFSPEEFGENYQKKTALWGCFNEPQRNLLIQENPERKRLALTNSQPLPKFDLLKSKEIAPEFYNKFSRQIRRSITSAAFAKAFYEANKADK